jgi:hypothetical protein
MIGLDGTESLPFANVTGSPLRGTFESLYSGILSLLVRVCNEAVKVNPGCLLSNFTNTMSQKIRAAPTGAALDLENQADF